MAQGSSRHTVASYKPSPKQFKSGLLAKPTTRRATLEGFTVDLIGFHPRHAVAIERMALLRAALRLYRLRVAKVFPWLAHHPQIIEARFEERCAADQDPGGILDWGFYDLRDTDDPTVRYPVTLCLRNFDLTNPPQDVTLRVAGTLAHEHGHYVWRRVLSEGARKAWREALGDDALHIVSAAELRDAWDATGTPRDTTRPHLTSLPLRDPRAYLTIMDLASTTLDWHDGGLYASLVRAARRGDSYKVPENPITTYARTNPEEAFCEALELLVTHGPKALFGPVRAWLTTALPELRGTSPAYRAR